MAKCIIYDYANVHFARENMRKDTTSWLGKVGEGPIYKEHVGGRLCEIILTSISKRT